MHEPTADTPILSPMVERRTRAASPERTFVDGLDHVELVSPRAAHAAGAYQLCTPAAALRRYVTRVHVGAETVRPDAPILERVLPAGTVDLVIDLGDVPRVVGARGGTTRARAAVLGATASAHVIRMAGRVDAVGVRLRAGGVAALLGVPAGELAAGRHVPLDALWGAEARALVARVAEAPPGAPRVAAVERFLLARLARTRATAHAAAAEAVRLIAASRGRATVRDVAAAIGVGERRLQQLFHVHVGLAPKALCRLARFHAALGLLRRDAACTWTDVVHRCGYADQPHLAHECRAIAGLTPGELRARLGFAFRQDAAVGAR